MHPCLGNWVAIGRAVVHYARIGSAFSAGIKCRHCMHLGQNIWWQSGVRSCIMPALPTYLVQELNVYTLAPQLELHKLL